MVGPDIVFVCFILGNWKGENQRPNLPSEASGLEIWPKYRAFLNIEAGPPLGFCGSSLGRVNGCIKLADLGDEYSRCRARVGWIRFYGYLDVCFQMLEGRVHHGCPGECNSAGGGLK